MRAREGSCIHFTGVQNKVCKAGLSYDTVRGDGLLPCLTMNGKRRDCRLCNNQRESAYAFSAWLASEYEDISLDDDDTVRQQMEHAWREAMKVANNEVTE